LPAGTAITNRAIADCSVNGSPSSGLAWIYTSLGDGSDELAFSNNGGSMWNHTPTADAFGFDVSAPLTTHIRMSPKGTMAGGSASGNPSFQLRFRVCIN